MKMNLASNKVRGLLHIYNAIRTVLPGDVSIYGLDEPHEEIFVLDIEESGGLEEVSVFYESGTYLINFWTCKPTIPNYHIWLSRYILCMIMLINTPSVKELDVRVLFDDGGTDEAICLREGVDSLMEILKESMDLPR